MTVTLLCMYICMVLYHNFNITRLYCYYMFTQWNFYSNSIPLRRCLHLRGSLVRMHRLPSWEWCPSQLKGPSSFQGYLHQKLYMSTIHIFSTSFYISIPPFSVPLSVCLSVCPFVSFSTYTCVCTYVRLLLGEACVSITKWSIH